MKKVFKGIATGIGIILMFPSLVIGFLYHLQILGFKTTKSLVEEAKKANEDSE